MCLTVSTRHRNLFTGKYKPKKLRRDLTVYKVLISEKGMRELAKTPFFGMLVEFTGGYFTPKTISYEDFKDVVPDVVRGKYKCHTKGGNAYHAYADRDEAIEALIYYYKNDYFRHVYNTIGNDGKEVVHYQFPYIYECVIPAGSYVYYGKDESKGQISSNAITIIQSPRIKVVRGLNDKLSCVYDNPQKYR